MVNERLSRMNEGFGFEHSSVESAFKDLVLGFYRYETRTEEYSYEDRLMTRRNSRDGDVIQLLVPVNITFTDPTNRVLLNPIRDCNPFFHVFETLWMLSGSDDLEPLLYYIKDFGRYSDDGKTLHGAYGKRWRNQFGFDQILAISEELKDNPDSRRCVLQMWDSTNWITPEGPVGKRDLHNAMNGGKDVPCNTHAYFLINDGKLDMTVCNRSNDLIWGMLGANVVHFSFLQEYVARMVNVPIGRYNQFTNNLHVYTSRWNPEGYIRHADNYISINKSLTENGARVPFDVHRPICTDFTTIAPQYRGDTSRWEGQSEFISKVASPMMRAHYYYKERDTIKAIDATNDIEDSFWKMAASEWILRREATRVT